METLYEITINAHCPETKDAYESWWKAKQEFDKAYAGLRKAVEASEPVRTTKRTTPYTAIGELKADGNPGYPTLQVTMRASVRKSEPPTAQSYDPYRSIQFKNLNDLNAAKFLTEDEKRRILGLPVVSKSEEAEAAATEEE